MPCRLLRCVDPRAFSVPCRQARSAVSAGTLTAGIPEKSDEMPRTDHLSRAPAKPSFVGAAGTGAPRGSMGGMNLQEFLDHVNRGAVIEGGSEQHRFMHGAGQDALRITAELNSGYRTPHEVRDLLSRLTGRSVDESVTVFPPFYSEFGKNLTLGKDVFINIGCRFQDTGGIAIGDGTLIGHGSTLTTLNHGVDPDHRADMIPAPIVIGRKVWLGAAVTVLPGVTIGDGPANAIVGGVPARLIRLTGFDAST